MQIPEFVVSIIVALISAGGFWALIDKGLEKNRKRRDEELKGLITEIKEINKELKETTELSKAFSRERLNFLSEK
ncbi:MAG: hypothetical protein IJH55_02985, partial [Romboutsia sp.]|nr:hypothetical protein [Romboutsia sp.]